LSTCRYICTYIIFAPPMTRLVNISSINPDQVCNGKRDCEGGEDEIASVCILKQLGSGPAAPVPTSSIRSTSISDRLITVSPKPNRPNRPSACSPIQVAEVMSKEYICFVASLSYAVLSYLPLLVGTGGCGILQ
jgi:hypothetical protein